MLQAPFLLTRSTLFAIPGGNIYIDKSERFQIPFGKLNGMCELVKVYDSGVLESMNRQEG